MKVINPKMKVMIAFLGLFTAFFGACDSVSSCYKQVLVSERKYYEDLRSDWGIR